jgi:undecaprenyl diphosphate synthase
METANDTIKSPACVGIIMDGNRRWAREQGLPTLEGHRRGYEKLKDVQAWCREQGIYHLAVYALSTENWKRSEEEVSYLMDLFRAMIEEFSQSSHEDSAVHFVGDLARFPSDIQESIDRLHASNSPEAQYHLWVAASYGGRTEIVHAVQDLLQTGVTEITEDLFSQSLWTAGMPDPDIIIRTGGEQRLSNFLSWQAVYSELFFPKTYWPAFTKEDFQSILDQYSERDRRHGR